MLVKIVQYHVAYLLLCKYLIYSIKIYIYIYISLSMTGVSWLCRNSKHQWRKIQLIICIIELCSPDKKKYRVNAWRLIITHVYNSTNGVYNKPILYMLFHLTFYIYCLGHFSLFFFSFPSFNRPSTIDNLHLLQIYLLPRM